MFIMDDGTKFRRLAKVGIYGHQPGIAAHVKTSEEEEQRIVEGLLAQKVGSNPKNQRAYKDFVRAKKDDSLLTLRVKIARLTTKSIVRWKRIRKSKEGLPVIGSLLAVDDGATPERTIDATPGCDQSRHRCQPTYTSRLLTCSLCYQTQETRWMQLRTTTGFRAIHCKYCKYQEYTAKTKCQCMIRWNHCPIHRVDPLYHSSKRGIKRPIGGQPKRKIFLQGKLLQGCSYPRRRKDMQPKTFWYQKDQTKHPFLLCHES